MRSSVALLTLLGMTAAALLIGAVAFIHGPASETYGGLVRVHRSSVAPPGGDPVFFPDGRFFLVDVTPGDSGPADVSGHETVHDEGGLVAIFARAPDQCFSTVVWSPNDQSPVFSDFGLSGGFRSGCGHSLFTRSGYRLFGPARRSLDRMPVSDDGGGWLIVNTGRIVMGPKVFEPLAQWKQTCRTPDIRLGFNNCEPVRGAWTPMR